MKIILLASTGGEPVKCGFPFWSSKPKHLYSRDGQIQLERIINQLFEAGFEQKDIEIVVGFKYQKIVNFLREKNFNIKVKINHHWNKSAAYTLQTALEGVEEDFMFYSADELVQTNFFKVMRQRNHKIYTKTGTGLKLFKEHIPLVKKVAEEYLHEKYIKNTSSNHGPTNINYIESTKTGIGLTFMCTKVLECIPDYKSIAIDVDKELPNYWIGDIDSFHQTDEYKNMNRFSYWIYYYISSNISSIYYYISSNISSIYNLLFDKDITFKEKCKIVIKNLSNLLNKK